jgi:hypothetical protein
MKPSVSFAVTAAALLLTFAADRAGRTFAQEPAPSRPLEQWLGEWRGTGTTSGAPAQLNLKWERALGGRFVRLTLVNEIGAEPTRQRFEGLAMYWPGAAGRLNGRWFDSQGATHLLDAVLEPDALIAEWGDGTTARGRSTYRLLAPDAMEVIDEIRGKDGTWREFGRFRMQRAPAA